MSNHNDEITFSQIFSMFKNSFKRAVIYVLVSVILVTAVLFTINSLTSYKSSSTIIYVSPKSQITQQDVAYNKSLAVQRALEDFVIDQNSEKFANTVLNSLHGTAIVPANLSNQTEFTPTSYQLTLDGKNLSALTVAQQNELLDNIARELLNSLGLSELPNAEIYNTLNSDLLTTEFFQIADEIYLQAENVSTIIDTQISSSPNATGYKDPQSGKSLFDVSNSFKAILKRIDNLKVNILINKTQNLGDLQTYLETKISQAQAQVTAYTDAVNASKDALTAFPSGPSGSSDNTYVLDSTAYENLAKEHNKLVNQLAVAKREANLYDSYYKTFKDGYNPSIATSDSEKQITTNTLKTICEDLNNELTAYKKLAKEYNQNYFITTEAKILIPATSFNQSLLSTKSIILIIGLTAIIAYLFAFFHANNKRKNNAVKEDKEIKQDFIPDSTK